MNWLNLLSDRRFSDRRSQKKSDEMRNRFEQDFDRVIFSQPFRSLQDKTQVFPLPEETFVHNRLTHSLEVSSVGRSLGKNAGQFILRKYPELSDHFSIADFGNIVSTACLAHDIGNPPFGHSGEEAISSFFLDSTEGQSFEALVAHHEWKDLTQFEGNAQGFRILISPLYKDLDLTFATFGTFIKYPLSSVSEKEKEKKSQKKYGYFSSSATLFEEVAQELQLRSFGSGKWCRHPLAFLSEAADDICYGIIDFEDGCRLGLLTLEEYTELLAEIIGEKFSKKKLNSIDSFNEKLGILRSMAIAKLVQECTEIFSENEKNILTGKFDQALTDRIPSASAMRKIASISLNKLYKSRRVRERESGGYAVIFRLMNAFCKAAYDSKLPSVHTRSSTIFSLLPQDYQISISKEDSVYGILQFVIDYVSSLTDTYAIRLDRIISGK